MPISDMLAIASFAIAMLGIVYAFGQRDEAQKATERDVNNLGKKLDQHIQSTENMFDNHDKRLDELSKFFVRVDERVAQLQRKMIGEEETERLRETISKPSQVKDYSSIDERWYSENSGIDM